MSWFVMALQLMCCLVLLIAFTWASPVAGAFLILSLAALKLRGVLRGLGGLVNMESNIQLFQRADKRAARDASLDRLQRYRVERGGLGAVSELRGRRGDAISASDNGHGGSGHDEFSDSSVGVETDSVLGVDEDSLVSAFGDFEAPVRSPKWMH